MVHVDVGFLSVDFKWDKTFQYLLELLLDLGARQFWFEVPFAVKLSGLDVAAATDVSVFDAKDNAVCGHDLLIGEEQDIANFDVLKLDWNVL